MNMMQNNRLFRILTAAVLLLLFTFTGLFAIHQNGTAINEAYASSSSNNNRVGFWDWGCVAAIAACLAAIAKGVAECAEHGLKSKQCAKAVGTAILVCADVGEECDWDIPWPEDWIKAGLV